MPASAILPLPTTRSSYWRPLGSLCTLPPSVAPPAAPPPGAALVVEGVMVALVVVEEVEVVSVLVSLQPGEGRVPAAQTATSQRLPQAPPGDPRASSRARNQPKPIRKGRAVTPHAPHPTARSPPWRLPTSSSPVTSTAGS